MTEPRRYMAMGEFPAELRDDVPAMEAIRTMAIEGWKRRVDGENYAPMKGPLGEPDTIVQKSAVPQVFDRWEGLGWFRRRFFKPNPRYVERYQYAMVVTGYVVPKEAEL